MTPFLSQSQPQGEEVNQCDGCARGLPVTERGTHCGPGSWDIQVCTADRYSRPTPAAADLHQQSHSVHLAGGDAGQDFRARSALSTSEPPEERRARLKVALAEVFGWEVGAPITEKQAAEALGEAVVHLRAINAVLDPLVAASPAAAAGVPTGPHPHELNDPPPTTPYPSPVAPAGVPRLPPDWQDHVRKVYHAARASPITSTVPSELLELMRSLLLSAGAPVQTQPQESSVHLAVNDAGQDFRMRPASSEAAPSAEGSEPKRGTDAQILVERELTCAAIRGAMAFGYQGVNPPPESDHWLLEFWQIGRDLKGQQ